MQYRKECYPCPWTEVLPMFPVYTTSVLTNAEAAKGTIDYARSARTLIWFLCSLAEAFGGARHWRLK